MKRKTNGFIALLLVLSILTTTIIPVFATHSRRVEKRVFIHYKKGYGKPAGTPGVGPNKDKTDDGGSYDLLAKGAMWKTTENIVIDTSTPDELTLSFVETAITLSANTWQNSAGFDLYGDILVLPCDGVDTVSPDGVNEVMFGDYLEEGVIAVTIVWGIFGGPPGKREIIEFDMLFDSTDFTWGDAEVDGSVMDMEDIATHELGHAFGLGDLYDASDSLETMYGYASVGETLKRDLYLGDIAGIQRLYGAP